jgi:predicted  nucleic acid-binding Zn-ribbon protein
LSHIQQLYHLQSLDGEIDKIQHQLAEIAARLGESETVRQAKTTVSTAETALRKTQTQMQDLTLEVKSLADKIVAEEKKLYQGKGFSAKEAANLQGEIASLKRRHSQREELLLEAMVEAEETEKVLAQARQRLSTVQGEWQADQEQLDQTQSALKSRLADLKAQRSIIVKPIDEDDLEEYEDLRLKKAGRAVAAVKGGICQGCGIAASSSKIQRARTETELVYCGTCGRILYVL